MMWRDRLRPVRITRVPIQLEQGVRRSRTRGVKAKAEGKINQTSEANSTERQTGRHKFVQAIITHN